MAVLATVIVLVVAAATGTGSFVLWRRRAMERARIEQQLETIQAIPSADFRLRSLEQLVG